MEYLADLEPEVVVNLSAASDVAVVLGQFLSDFSATAEAGEKRDAALMVPDALTLPLDLQAEEHFHDDKSMEMADYCLPDH